VNDWNDVSLGVIAVATLVMALIQVGAILVAAKVARQAQEMLGKAQATIATAQQTIASVHEEIRPLIAKASAIADEASKTAALATAQVQKIDRLVTDLSKRVDETSAVVQQAIVTPAREGLAIVAAIKAAATALRAGADWRRRTSRSEEEDPLFIG
jgi:predicted PurR-regulated permease PerM